MRASAQWLERERDGKAVGSFRNVFPIASGLRDPSGRLGRNITLQRTLISEALNAAGHKKYPPGTQHGYAASIGGDVGSFHHNLLAHCAGRNWSLAGGLSKPDNRYAGRLDIRNNVVLPAPGVAAARKSFGSRSK